MKEMLPSSQKLNVMLIQKKCPQFDVVDIGYALSLHASRMQHTLIRKLNCDIPLFKKISYNKTGARVTPKKNSLYPSPNF